MQSLANYRSMHMRMQQLAAEGALDGGEVDAAAHDRAAAGGELFREDWQRCLCCAASCCSVVHSLNPLPTTTLAPTPTPAEMHAAAAGNIVAAMSDLDGFTAKLSAILQADLTHAGAHPGWTDGVICLATAARQVVCPAMALLAFVVQPAQACLSTHARPQPCCSPHATCAALAAGPLEVAPNLMQQLGSVLAVEPGAGGHPPAAWVCACEDCEACVVQLAGQSRCCHRSRPHIVHSRSQPSATHHPPSPPPL